MDDPTPWKRLKREILRMIDTGVLEPGDDVSVTLECADFGIRYENGRKAFRELAAEGWLLYVGPNQPYRVPPAPDPGNQRGS